MRRMIALVLIFSLAYQPLGKTIFLAYYLVAQEKFEAACINKEKPELNCNGKCQAMALSERGTSESTPLLQRPTAPVKPDFGWQDMTFVAVMAHGVNWTKDRVWNRSIQRNTRCLQGAYVVYLTKSHRPPNNA